MKSIFRYINYREFLDEYYQEKKSTTRYFSHRYFVQKAGIKSPNFLKQIIAGERNLTRPMIEKFCQALELNKKDAQFFRNLVLFNQAKTALEKQEHYSVMVTMKDYVKQYQLTADQYSFFDNWYNAVVRELVCLYDFKDNYELIGKSILPVVSAKDIKKSIQLLLRLKLLRINSKGLYEQTQASLTSGIDIVSLSRRAYNSKILELSQKANNELSPEIRNISNITMGVSKECYDVILSEMLAFKERVVSIVNQDKGSSRVYQLCLSLFPQSIDVHSLENKKGLNLKKGRVK